jgi:DNA repair exonuclease SbcCD ATPase subunit
MSTAAQNRPNVQRRQHFVSIPPSRWVRHTGFDNSPKNWEVDLITEANGTMKNFLQNLLIFFSLALCALIAFQWVRETHLRKEVQDLTNTVSDKTTAILNLQATIRRDEAEIQRLDGLRNQLTATVKSNQVEIARLTKEFEKAQAESEKNLKQGEAYKEALQTANTNIKKQNEEISKQNEEMKALDEGHKEAVLKFNKMAADFNDLVNKWNKQQQELAKAATNSPPAKH